MKKYLKIFKELILMIALTLILFIVLFINSFVCYFFTSLFINSDWIFIIPTILLSTIEIMFLYFIDYIISNNIKEDYKNEINKN